jgi:hypothetical protein
MIAAKWFEAQGVVLVSEDKYEEPHLMGRANKKSKVVVQRQAPLLPQAQPHALPVAAAPLLAAAQSQGAPPQ